MKCEAGKFCQEGPDGNCGSLRLETTAKTTSKGNLLVIFDQSASMDGMWQMTTKLEAAKTALVAAITPLQDLLTVGTVFLPTVACLGMTPQGGAVAPIEDATQINFMPAPMFLQAFDQHWGMMRMQGLGTPLNEAFDRADVALTAARANMTLTGKVGVVVFTDGEPNCMPNPDMTGIPTMTEPDRAAQWVTSGIKTYVVGLPGSMGVTLLDNIAMSGGTMTYITPDDPAELAAKLKEVVEDQISTSFDSCSLMLKPPANNPDKLQLVAEENGVRQDVPHQLAADSSWTISPDGVNVELMGRLCDDAKSGRFDALTFEYGCDMLPPLPPNPPLQ